MTIYDVIKRSSALSWRGSTGAIGLYLGIGMGYRNGLIDGTRVNVVAYRRFHDAMRGLGWEMGSSDDDE